MDPAPPSPSPARWFKALRRPRIGDCCCTKVGPNACAEQLRRARAAFQTGRTRKASFRRAQLEALVRLLAEHECDFVDVVCRDLHKPRFETVVSELIAVKNEALYAINNLAKWMEPQHVERNLATSLDECMVVSEPLGVVLVVGAWYSPVQLCLVPLVGAIAAGNCAIVNPSDTSSHTAELLHRLLPSYLDNECYHVLVASVSDLPEIIDLKFDHIFFTGGRTDGTKVAQAAARHLTPVTLVLEGKNPCYVDQDGDISTAARRIAWACFQNAGQSAAAPDYVLCHEGAKAQLLHGLRCTLLQFYGCDPRQSRSFGRMVNADHFARVRDTLGKSGIVAVGGQVNEAEKYIAPTVLTEVIETDPIMQQEVFGPVLPILTVSSVDEAISFICRREKPLCVYVYSSNSKGLFLEGNCKRKELVFVLTNHFRCKKPGEIISRLMEETSSGSFCANDSVLQTLMAVLPFGGVGASGMGSYHGHASFNTFSHRKSCLLRSTRIECVTYLRYPPYEDRNLSLMTWASTLTHKSQGWCQIL